MFTLLPEQSGCRLPFTSHSLTSCSRSVLTAIRASVKARKDSTERQDSPDFRAPLASQETRVVRGHQVRYAVIGNHQIGNQGL